MRIMRLAITREEEGGKEVPVAMSWREGEEEEEVEEVRLKNRVGTEPQVRGATKVAVAEEPGWR